MDTYERLIKDLKYNAVVLAFLALPAAMNDSKIPPKPIPEREVDDRETEAIFTTSRRPSPRRVAVVGIAVVLVICAACAAFVVMRTKQPAALTEGTLEKQTETTKGVESSSTPSHPPPATPAGMTMEQFAQPPAGYAD